LDTSKLNLSVKISKEAEGEGKKAHWTFYVNGKKEDMDSVEDASGAAATKAKVDPRQVKPDEEKYDLTCRAGFDEDPEKQTELPKSWKIYPGMIELEVKPKKSEAKKLKGQSAILRLGGTKRDEAGEICEEKEFGAAVDKTHKIKPGTLGLNDGPFGIGAKSPWVVEVKNGPEIKQKCQVEVYRKSYKLQVVSHPVASGRTEDKRHMQWVNQDPGGDPGSTTSGPLVKVTIGAVDLETKAKALDLALKDDEFHIKVTLQKEVKPPDNGKKVGTSKRAVPLPGVWKDAAGTKKHDPKPSATKVGKKKIVWDMTGKKALKLDKDGGVIELFLHLGNAGGVTFQVEVGVTKKAEDDTAWFQSMRKLEYAVAAPEVIKTSIGGENLPANTTTFMTKAFDAGFLKFAQKQWSSLSDDECSDYLVEPAYFKCKWEAKYDSDLSKLGRKAYVLAPGGRSDLAAKFPAASNLAINIQLCDGGYSWTNEAWKSESPIVDGLEGGAYYHPITKGCLPKTLTTWWLNNTNMGAAGLSTLSMKKADGSKRKWKAQPPADNKAHPGWEEVPGTDPKEYKAKSGTLEDDGWKIEYHDYLTIKLTPDGDAKDLIGAASATKCPIKISFQFLPSHGVLGTSGSGGLMLVYGKDSPETLGSTIGHELGHSMGMTITPGNNAAPGGLPAPNHVDSGTKGYYYVDGTPDGSTGKRNIHVGSHCAYKLSKKNRKADKLVKTNKALPSGICIMYGSGGNNADDAKRTFCPTCTEMLTARNLDDISKTFAGRSDEDA